MLDPNRAGKERGVYLGKTNMDDLARGCALLGSGGGGDVELSLLMARRYIAKYGPVRVIAPSELPDDALVMPCGMVGAPALAAERLWNGAEGARLVDAVQRLRGARVAALMPYSIGGANGVLPVAWAAQTGLPLLDADGMGRAFWDLHQQAMELAGIPPGPVVLTEGSGDLVVLHPKDGAGMERLARGVAAHLGGVCAAALYCMTGAQARRAAIDGSISRALLLGRTGAPPATVLLEGRIIDIERYVQAGRIMGSAIVQGIGVDTRRRLRLELRSELVLAVEDGEIRASVPDLIAALSAASGVAIDAERLRHGQRVAVVTCPAPAVWRSEAGHALAGPAVFGLPSSGEPAPTPEPVHAGT
jgi:DUF917 family protein